MTFWAVLSLLEIAYLLSLLLNILHFQSYHSTVFLCDLVNKWLLKKKKKQKVSQHLHYTKYQVFQQQVFETLLLLLQRKGVALYLWNSD